MKSRLNRAVFVVFAVLIGAHLVYVLQRADIDNQSEHGKIFSVADDPTYQIPAINMLHGLGFWQSLNLPIDDYHLELMGFWKDYLLDSASHPQTISYAFFRAPGFPMLLTATYALFGDSPITARRMLAVLAWATALLLLIIGATAAGWIGSLAGGLAGLYTIRFQPDLSSFTRIMTEIPAAFWLTLFMLCFIVYLRRKQTRYLLLSAVTFAVLMFTRSVFAFGLPMFIIILFLKGHSYRRILLFIVTIMIPVGMWSAYASTIYHTFVPMTVQGAAVFPQYNNIDVLEGNFIDAGNWNPGEVLLPDGSITYDSHNSAASKENPWIKGLTFWAQHVPQLPQLFYEKLRASFWFVGGRSENEYQMERLHLFGVGVLLFAVGFRKSRRKTVLHRLSARTVLILQLGLLSMLFVASNRDGLFLLLLIWAAILLLAVLRPYGELYQGGGLELTAFLGFAACQAVTAMLYGGDGVNRFQHPLDPLLMLCSLIGLFTITVAIVRRLYQSIRQRQVRPWAVILPFAAADLVLLIAAYALPNVVTERWMVDHIPQNARIVADYVTSYDILPSTRDQGWNWKLASVNLAQNNPDFLSSQDTYILVDERAAYEVAFKTRVETLVNRGAILLYQSTNPLDIGLRQAILLQPPRQMIFRNLNATPPNGDG